MKPVLEDLLPAAARLVVRDIGAAADALFPAEADAVRAAVPARRAQFQAGRDCARRALRALGAPAGAIPVGPGREPLWPPGVVGSISHAGSRAAAAVAWAGEFRGLGLDIEEAGTLEGDALALVALEAEVHEAARVVPAGLAGRLVFSAKETVFKCVYPLLRTFIGFHDVRLRLGPDGFLVTMAPECRAGEIAAALRGRWRIEGDLIATAAWIEAAAGVSGPGASR